MKSGNSKIENKNYQSNLEFSSQDSRIKFSRIFSVKINILRIQKSTLNSKSNLKKKYNKNEILKIKIRLQTKCPLNCYTSTHKIPINKRTNTSYIKI